MNLAIGGLLGGNIAIGGLDPQIALLAYLDPTLVGFLPLGPPVAQGGPLDLEDGSGGFALEGGPGVLVREDTGIPLASDLDPTLVAFLGPATAAPPGGRLLVEDGSGGFALEDGSGDLGREADALAPDLDPTLVEFLDPSE